MKIKLDLTLMMLIMKLIKLHTRKKKLSVTLLAATSLAQSTMQQRLTKNHTKLITMLTKLSDKPKKLVTKRAEQRAFAFGK